MLFTLTLPNHIATSNCQGSHTGQEVIFDLFFCAQILETHINLLIIPKPSNHKFSCTNHYITNLQIENNSNYLNNSFKLAKKTAFAVVKQRRLENLKPYGFKKQISLKTNFFYLRPELPVEDDLSRLLVEPAGRLLPPELPELTADLD
jgi:hypothetical protein